MSKYSNNNVTMVHTEFFKENVRCPVGIYRDPISLILGTRWHFSLILGTRIGSLKRLKKPWFIHSVRWASKTVARKISRGLYVCAGRLEILKFDKNYTLIWQKRIIIY